MKRVLISIFAIFCLTGAFAQELTLQIDTAAEKGKRKSGTVSEAQLCINDAGKYLSKSGRLRNGAIAVPVITSIGGGALIADALYRQNRANNNATTKTELYSGIAVAGAGLLIGIILEARSSHYVKKAGKRLQQFQFTGTSLTYNF